MWFMPSTEVGHPHRRESIVGTYTPQLLMSMLVDSGTACTAAEALEGWLQDCKTVIKKFYSRKDFMEATVELQELMVQGGDWGDELQSI